MFVYGVSLGRRVVGVYGDCDFVLFYLFECDVGYFLYFGFIL